MNTESQRENPNELAIVLSIQLVMFNIFESKLSGILSEILLHKITRLSLAGTCNLFYAAGSPCLQAECNIF